MTLLNMIITQKSKRDSSFRIKKNSSLGFNTDKDYRILVRIIFFAIKQTIQYCIRIIYTDT
jgi:hypothetical protein